MRKKACFCFPLLSPLVDVLTVSQQDPDNTVKMFIDLVQRHEHSFYNFVHKVHSKGAGLFDNLMRWVELFLTVVREGIGKPISLEYLLPHTGQERLDILKEVDAVALYHYRLKVAYESKVRKRFGRGTAGVGVNGRATVTADEDDEATQTLVDGAVKNFSFGDLMQGDAEDLVAEESESEESEETETETETEADSYETAGSGDRSAMQTPLRSPATTRIPATAPLVTEQVPRSSFGLSSPNSGDALRQRKRSLSLRSSRSTDSGKARNSVIDVVPPVPSLPPSASRPVPLLQSAPPSRVAAPSRRKTMEDLKRTTTSVSLPRKSRKSKKKHGPDIKPPDLKVIPDLLPLFTEVVRCAEESNNTHYLSDVGCVLPQIRSSLRPRPL